MRACFRQRSRLHYRLKNRYLATNSVTATTIDTVTTDTTTTTTTNAAITYLSLWVFYIEKVEAALPTDNIEKQSKTRICGRQSQPNYNIHI